MSNQNNQGLRDPIWQFIWGAVAAVLAIIAIIVGILALPQAAPARTFISHTFAGTTPTSEIPTAPPPTPTPKIIPENITIPCLTCQGGNYALTLKLNTITIDYANQQTIMKYTLTNIGTVSCTVIFDKLEFQDDNGTIFKAQNVGQSIVNIAVTNSFIASSTFDLVPRPNTHYLLTTSIACTNRIDFKNQDFVFN